MPESPDGPMSDLDPAAVARLRRVGGDKLLREMIDLFLTHAPARLESALSARDASDVEGIERAVHSLKSTAGNLGGRAVQHLAEEIEALAADRRFEAAAALLPELELRFGRLSSALQRERPASPRDG